MNSQLESGLKEWKDREQRLEKLASPSFILKQKLAHYEMLQARFGRTANAEDRSFLRSLRRERRKMERTLFPNLAVRLLRRLVLAVDLNARSAKIAEASGQKRDQLGTAVREAGFGAYTNQVAARLKQANSAEVTFPVLWMTGEKERMDMHLKFSRQPDGHYVFDGYQAALKKDNEPRHFFYVEQNTKLNTSQLYNLLSGRAVYAEGTGWQQLDFNDKDQAGNYRLRHTPPHHRFDIVAALDKLPLKLQYPEQEITERLRNGEKVPVTLFVGNKNHEVTLIADPIRNEIRIQNEQNQKVSLYELKNPGKVVAIKPDNSEGNTISTRKRNSMKM